MRVSRWIIDDNVAIVTASREWVSNVLILFRRSGKVGVLGVSKIESRLKSWFYTLMLLSLTPAISILIRVLFYSSVLVFTSFIIMVFLTLFLGSWIPVRKCVILGRRVVGSLKGLYETRFSVKFSRVEKIPIKFPILISHGVVKDFLKEVSMGEKWNEG